MILAPIIVRKSPEQVKECRRFHLARKLSYRHMIRYGISDPVSNVLVRATPNLKTVELRAFLLFGNVHIPCKLTLHWNVENRH